MVQYNWYGILEGIRERSEAKFFIPLILAGIIVLIFSYWVMAVYEIDMMLRLSYLVFGWFVFLLGAVLLGIIVGQSKK